MASLGIWALELGLKPVPLGEVAQLWAIRARQLYRDEEERRHVHRRLDEITRGRRAVRDARAVA